MAAVFKKYTPPPTPIEYLRYRTVVEVAFDSSAAYSRNVRADTTRDIANVIDRTWGQMWNAKVVENSWLGPSTNSLSSLDPTDLIERYPHTEIDKVFFVGVNSFGSGSEIACVEWDCASQTLSDVEFEATEQAQLISEAAGRAMRNAFRPLLKLYRASKTSSRIEMRVMGGEYPAPDPDAAQIKVGDAIVPFLQYRNRKEKEKIERIQLLPLNYLIVERSERGRVIGPLLSAYRSPFGGKARSVQQLALRKRPVTESSVVKLVLQGRPDRPLVGHRVVMIPKLTVRDEKLDEPKTLLTDRHGQVTIDRDDRFTNFWLYIRSGEFALATVPYVPGIHHTETVAVPNDSVRLSVEGEVSLIRSRLLETVARQAVVKAKAMQLAKKGKLEEAKRVLEQLSELPGLEDFLSDINAFQVPALEKTRKGRPAYNKIVKKCNAVITIVKRFFSKDKDTEFMQKLIDANENSKFDK